MTHAELAQRCLQYSQGDALFLDRATYPEECVFHVNGKFNKHNVGIWGKENLYGTRKVAKNIEKVVM